MPSVPRRSRFNKKKTARPREFWKLRKKWTPLSSHVIIICLAFLKKQKGPVAPLVSFELRADYVSKYFTQQKKSSTISHTSSSPSDSHGLVLFKSLTLMVIFIYFAKCPSPNIPLQELYRGTRFEIIRRQGYFQATRYLID